jgi:hypothetical protein
LASNDPSFQIQRMQHNPLACARFGAAFALGEEAVFGLEDGSGVLKRWALGLFAGAVLDLEINVPIRGDLLGALELLLLGRDAVIAAGQVGRALPEGAAIPAVRGGDNARCPFGG